jgi:hypothetical protein
MFQDTDGVAFASEAGCDGEARNAGANYVMMSVTGARAKDIGGIGVIGEHGNMSYEGANVTVVDP